VLGIRLRHGVPDTSELSDAVGESVAVAVVAAARLASELGAAPAGVLDQVLAGAEADADAHARRAAALAGPRASARVLAWLPVLGLGLGLGMGVDPVAVLLDGGAGTAALLAGATAWTLGALWTRRLVAAAQAVGT
jgi:tight adherence protein B